MNRPDEIEFGEVFREWSLYEKVIHGNFMRHREMTDAIRSSVAQMSIPLNVLDLGCGDGQMAVRGLFEGDVQSYVGCDLSQAALEEAATNLKQLLTDPALHHMSFVELLTQDFDPAPNFVLASYSLHHVTEIAQVATIVGRIAEVLASGGDFLWIDLQRHELETRDCFLRRFCEELLPSWELLNAHEREQVVAHMNVADYPLTESEKQNLAVSAGLRGWSTLYSDDYYAAHLCRKV